MNHYHITFKSGKQMEFQAFDNEQAMKRADSWLKRWNHPSATIERVNIMNPSQKIYIGLVENDTYDAAQPSLTQDPEYLYKRPEPTKKPKSAAKTATGERKPSEPRSTHAVPLASLADQLGVPATSIRRKLRSSKVEKPTGGWGWDSMEDSTVVQIIEWFKKES